MASSTLPQHDPDPGARRGALESARARYVYDPTVLPPFNLYGELPADERLGVAHLTERLAAAARAPANALAVRLRTLFDPFDELQDYDDLFALVARPPVADTWRSDAAFAEQRLSGVEPRVLRRLDVLPDHLRVDPALFAAIAGEPLDRAGFEGRLYLADYALLDGLPPGGSREHSRFLYAPLVLYHWAEDPDATRDTPPAHRGRLLPVAIQLDQTPSRTNLYTPRDGLDWLLARTVAQNADFTLSTLAHHLARVHLGLEPFAMATARQLGEAHPIGRLLRPHLRHLLGQDELSRRLLLGPGGAVERLFGPTREGSLELLRRSFHAWRLDDAALPRDLERRGLADATILPHYPWRDDGRLVWDALAEFVAAYVRLVYPTDVDLALDAEIRAWLEELADPARGNLRGLPPDLDPTSLADLLTTVIFTAGPDHAATSYRLPEYAAHVPNYPAALYGPMPAVRGLADDAALLAMLPPQAASLEQLELVAQLSAYQHDQFGHYELDDQLHEPPELQELVVTFQERLVSAEARILERNRDRPVPYLGMLPSKLANSPGV